MILEHGSIDDDDVGENLLIINKMAKDYCVQHGITLRKIKNTRSRYTQRCINNDCSFKIHATVLVDKCTWMIRSLTEGHKYSNTQFNKHASSRCVASKLLDEFKDNSNMDKETMQKTLMRRFGVAIPDYICWRARKLRKIQRVSQASTSITAASGVPTQSSQAI
ncbi:hypothetical protein Cgig2_012846 [Carnegiea gigantea]|uniref:Transposase MuDR plant domain-containing protein n=1 Tax=Carnegiea gigantea TaxID=171969 RepID=A0A9Q1K9S9_9CARY|nr:hypothetical protein Cgig2_012846 [Carnegiea gigantea]